MTDPMDALRSLDQALKVRAIELQRCELAPELGVLLDQPNGKPRFTYAMVEGKEVVAVALFVMTEPLDQLPCFQIGYAVRESRRSQGLGTKVLVQAIAELRHGLSRTPMRDFCIEAVAAKDNHHSNRIARRLISTAPEEGTDEFSGEPIYQYTRRVTSGA